MCSYFCEALRKKYKLSPNLQHYGQSWYKCVCTRRTHLFIKIVFCFHSGKNVLYNYLNRKRNVFSLYVQGPFPHNTFLKMNLFCWKINYFWVAAVCLSSWYWTKKKFFKNMFSLLNSCLFTREQKNQKGFWFLVKKLMEMNREVHIF